VVRDANGGAGEFAAEAAYQHVDVVGGAIDDEGRRMHFADDASKIGK
jgi:hypothetical protein